MPGRVEGKVAFITGAARGQGRSHAVRLAQEGADIIAVDMGGPVDGVMYPMPGPEDLAETVKEVEALDRRIVATQGDVRDYDALKAAVKHGVIGLMRTLALEMAHHKIRVNTIMPTQVNTPMAVNEGTFRLFRPDLENPTIDDFAIASAMTNPLQVPWMEPEDISNAVLFLASDESRYITGLALPVDAGSLLK
jgi:NAD(P)-dependent dehydrogenase (short-subunit alcohol dehydrogenase family)